MAEAVIYIKGKKYYYYETYDTWEDAYKMAIYFKKKDRSKYFILKTDKSFLFPLGEFRYRLYLTRILRLGW